MSDFHYRDAIAECCDITKEHCRVVIKYCNVIMRHFDYKVKHHNDTVGCCNVITWHCDVTKEYCDVTMEIWNAKMENWDATVSLWHHTAGFEGTKYSDGTVHAHIALIYHISPLWSHKFSNIHMKMNQWTYAFRFFFLSKGAGGMSKWGRI